MGLMDNDVDQMSTEAAFGGPQAEADQKAKLKKIPVMEIFGPTIQGEGAMIGVRTSFIRFGLCDYKCKMCDSMHAVDPMRVKANAKYMTQDEIFEEYMKIIPDAAGCHWVTLSGGNPCIHNLQHLVGLFTRNGIRIAVETQGTFLPDWLYDCDVVTVSPKSPGMGEEFEQDKFIKYVESFQGMEGFNVKVVVFNAMDLDWARTINNILIEKGGYGASEKMYLSLGNPYPPGSDNESMLGSKLSISPSEEMKLELMSNYRQIAEDLLQIPDLYNVKFLPQLHVLAWANKQMV